LLNSTRERFNIQQRDIWNIDEHGIALGGNHLIFANYKKAYGTQGYEAKTLIIKERRNPPLAMQQLLWYRANLTISYGTGVLHLKPMYEHRQKQRQKACE
jgi:hypothetical protein